MFKILSFLMFGLPLLIIGIVFQGTCAIITSFIAYKKGRSAIGWFFIGLVVGVIGLIIIFAAPNFKIERKKEKKLNDEINQLREELMAEKKKNAEFREIVSRHIKSTDNKTEID